jgi:type I restriction enzyme S subunit
MNKKGPSPRSKAPERVTIKVIEASSAAEDAALEQEAPAALVPKLRFPEFQTAEGWVAESLGELYSFKGNNSLSREKLNYTGGSVKNLHYGDIHTKFSTHFDIRKEAVPFINETESSTIREENFCIEGDMVFADASEDLDDIGKSIEIIALNGEKVVSGLHTILARRTSDCIAIGFGGHLFKSAFVRSQIQREAQGSKVLGISGTRLRNLILPLPPTLSEQQRIADCLTSLDELIAAQGRKLDALKTHKSGLMQQLFPREGETIPSLRFPEFQDAGEWEEQTLGSIGSFSSGGTPSKDNPNYWNGTIPWVSASSMYAITIKRADHYVTPLAIGNGTRIAKRGSILILVRGSMLFNRVPICVAGIDVAFNQDVKALDLATSINGTFILYQLLAFQSRFLINETGIGAGKIELDTLKGFGVGLPSFSEQQRIADCLSALDEVIAAQGRKLAMLKTHKKGLMQQLFPTMEQS